MIKKKKKNSRKKSWNNFLSVFMYTRPCYITFFELLLRACDIIAKLVKPALKVQVLNTRPTTGISYQ